MNVLLSLTPTAQLIYFESYPDFTDNTYPVYLILKKLLPDYKMVWFDRRIGKIFTIKNIYYEARCRVSIFCNSSQKKKYRRKQLAIYLDHGSPCKNISGFYNIADSGVDYHNIQSHYFDEILAEHHNTPPEKRIYLGYPRCDYFYSPSRREDINQIITGKYIMWLPTFRGHNSKTRDDAPGSIFNNIGVPLFYDLESLNEFNSFLRNSEISILYKPHFAQDLDVVKKIPLSNFKIIYDNDILDKNLQLYEVIAQSEALITDYSSVIWDYMLLDRPIAITTDDWETYKTGRGCYAFMEEVHEESAEILPDKESLINFIMNVLNKKDTKRDGRRKWRDLGNMHQDGKSAERAAKFILAKIGRL